MRLPCALLVLLYLVTANDFVFCKVLATPEEGHDISGNAGALVATSRKLLAKDIKKEQVTEESLEVEDDSTETETELMLPDETDEESSSAVDAKTKDKKKKEQPLSELEDEQVTDSLAVEEKQQIKEVKEPAKKKEEKAPQPEESAGEPLVDEEKDDLMKEKTPSKKTVSQEQEQNTDLLLNEKQQVKEGKKPLKRNKLTKKKASSGETAKKSSENVDEISNLEIEKEKTQLEVEASSEDQYQIRGNSQKKQKQAKKQKLDLEADQESNVDVETTDIVDQKVEEDATQYDFEAKTKPVVTTKKGGKLKKKGKGTMDSEVSTAESSDQVTAGQKRKKDKKTSIESKLEDTGANAEEESEEMVSSDEEGSTDDTLLADVTKKPKKGLGKKVPSAELDLMEDESVEDDTQEKLQKKVKSTSKKKEETLEVDSENMDEIEVAKEKPTPVLAQEKLQKKEKSTSKKKEETLEVDSENMDEIEVVKEKPTPVLAKQKEKKKKTQSSVLVSNKDLELQVQENVENKADEASDTESENIETVKKTDKREKPAKKPKKEKTSKVQKKEAVKEEVEEEAIDSSSDGLTDKKEVGKIQPKEVKKTRGKDGAKKATDSGLELQLETDPRADEKNEPQAQKSSTKIQEQELKVGEEESEDVVKQQHTSETKGSENVSMSKESQGDSQEGMTSATDDEDDEYGGDFMQDLGDLPTKFQDTAQKVAGHLGPNIQKITDTSKTYFNKANQQITESFSPLVGKQFAPLLASLISYGLLLIPLAVVILLFEHIRALVSLQKVMLFVNIYLAAYFVTLLLATFIIGEPMAFFYKSSPSGYIHLQLLQALGYILYLVLQTVDLFYSCTSEKVLIKVTSTLQWLVAFMIGLHYYVTVFHRAMGLKGPRTSWKIYGIYSISFFILCLFARLQRTKKGYTQVGDADTNKKN